MYGQYRNSGIIRLRTYAQALDWFEKTTPIRGKGRNAGIKPLGHRNRPWFQIRKVEMLSGEVAVACRLYDTDVVTFYPDNTIVVKTDGYASQTTANFIRDVLPIGASIYDRSVVAYLSGNRQYRVGKRLVLKLEEGGRDYEVVEYEKSYTYTLNRKELNKLRKETEPFRTYAVGITKLLDGVFEKEDDEEIEALTPRRWGSGATKVAAKQALDKLLQKEDDGNWHSVMKQLAFSGYWWSTRVRLRPESMVKRIDEALMCAAPEVFVVQEVPAGQVKRNRYSKFIPYVTGEGV